MPIVNGQEVSPEEYIIHHRDRYNEGLIDLHEYGRKLREAAQYRISPQFLMGR